MADLRLRAVKALELARRIERLQQELELALQEVARERLLRQSDPGSILKQLSILRDVSGALHEVARSAAAAEGALLDSPRERQPLQEQRPQGLAAVIHLETDSIQRSVEFVTAWKQLAEANGVTLRYAGPPVFGSFRQRFRLWVRGGKPQDEVDRRIQKFEHATEVALLGKPMAEADKASAEAIQALASSAAGFNNLVAMSRATILVKSTDDDGKSSGLAKTLTVEQIKEFEQDPSLLRDARRALEFLSPDESAELASGKKPAIPARKPPLAIEGPNEPQISNDSLPRHAGASRED